MKNKVWGIGCSIRKHKVSLAINTFLGVLVAASFLFEVGGLAHMIFLSIGLFGLSGSLTNSLAIHMLFERVPFIYGSGIIALNFEEIKRDLEELMVQQFFNREQIERFLGEESAALDLGDLGRLEAVIDFDILFDRFKEGLSQGFKDNPMMLLALPLLESNREKIVEAMRQALRVELQNEGLQAKVKGLFSQQLQVHENFEQKVRGLICQRLDEMTPKMVKEVIQHMMESKLIWLVVWGALFGALIGLVSALLRYFLLF